jgi:hypothetical protein
MRTLIYVAVLLVAGAAAASLAQQPPSSTPPPKAEAGSKAMASCLRDTRKYCSSAPRAIVKECLVQNWDRISGDCQDALSSPIRRGAARGD